MRIVFFGDSLTAGSYGGSFVSEIAARVPQHEILNAGQNGSTAVNLLRRLDRVLKKQPDAVFLMIGGNDALSYSQPDTRAYYRSVQKIPDGCVTPDLFARTYRELLTEIQLAHVLVWVGLEPAEYSPAVAAALDEYNAIAQDVAASLNVPVLDLRKHFKAENLVERPPLGQKQINQIGKRVKAGWHDYENERLRGGFTFTFDGLHFTPEAAQQAAGIILDFLDL